MCLVVSFFDFVGLAWSIKITREPVGLYFDYARSFYLRNLGCYKDVINLGFNVINLGINVINSRFNVINLGVDVIKMS